MEVQMGWLILFKMLLVPCHNNEHNIKMQSVKTSCFRASFLIGQRMTIIKFTFTAFMILNFCQVKD